VVVLTPLPWLFVSLLSAFAPLFSDRVWQQAQVLLIGAMLAPGKRTVTSCLRITGRSQEPLDQFDAPNANTLGRAYLCPPVSDLSGSQSSV
jgi:hypothetical protein